MSFERSIQLLGQAAFERLQTTRVILFGVGGVGGWCAEALVRTGLGHLTLVDFDEVNPSNINRQIVATSDNIGCSKVEEMRKRLMTINPDLDCIAEHTRYNIGTCNEWNLADYDYVIDAIDSVDDKLLLIHRATAAIDEATGKRPTLLSSMGAGRKTDVSQIRISEFSKVEGCPLARSLRRKIRDSVMNGHSLAPQRKFQCVWSPEISAESGTIAPIVGVFGMTLANLVIQDIL
ncbi:MAG: ThiF family adenylyltransferase [Paludibacteraceae bacterium]|nr:ThiF family adenylyltransferase [Paludibacteraceae bacterium]